MHLFDRPLLDTLAEVPEGPRTADLPQRLGGSRKCCSAKLELRSDGLFHVCEGLRDEQPWRPPVSTYFSRTTRPERLE